MNSKVSQNKASTSDLSKASLNKSKDIKKTMSSPSSIVSSSFTEKVSSLIYSNTSANNIKNNPSVATNNKKSLPTTTNQIQNNSPTQKSRNYFNLESWSNKLNRFTK